MSDQWGRKIWEAIQELSILPGLNAALGNYPGIVPKIAAGYALNVNRDTSSPFTLSVSDHLYQGQDRNSFLIRFRFTSGEDSKISDGAQRVQFRGLMEDFTPFSFELDTKGTLPQTIAGLKSRILSVKVVRTGSSKTNIGTLQCWPDGGSDTQRMITMLPGDAYASPAAFTSQLGHYVFLKHISVRVDFDIYQVHGTNSESSLDVRLRLQARKAFSVVDDEGMGTWATILNFSAGNEGPSTFDVNIMLEDMVDVRILLETPSGFKPDITLIPGLIVSSEIHYWEINTGTVDVSDATIFEVF